MREVMKNTQCGSQLIFHLGREASMLRRSLGLGAVVVMIGCATIMHGTSQDVGLSSVPTAATVTVDNKPLGSTPVVAHLKRKDNHIIHFELDGYKPYDATITRGTSGWVWGNIVFGGLIGLAVDAMTGGLYKLTPEQVTAAMAGQTAEASRDGLFVTVVLAAEPQWERVGQLTRE